MRKIAYLALCLAGLFALAACDKTDTYADQKDRERAAINRYISAHGIRVISEEEFNRNDSTTDVSKNEYVLFANTGVYMQIVRKGVGTKLQNNEQATVLCRFTERNLLKDTVQLSNDVPYFSSVFDKMRVRRNYASFTGSFDAANSLMARIYRSTSVPAGWLVPLAYVNLGRPAADGEEIAKVNLIVPHTEGQSNATQRVYPCLYHLTYQRGK